MGKLTVRAALTEAEENRWQCETCDKPAQEDKSFCLHCEIYWDDVRNGMFDFDDSALAQEAGR